MGKWVGCLRWDSVRRVGGRIEGNQEKICQDCRDLNPERKENTLEVLA